MTWRHKISDMYKASLRDRVKLNCREQNGCWLWLCGKFNHGYPLIVVSESASGVKKQTALAHQASYVAFREGIPEGYELHHTCKTRMCVNPWHLICVTKKQHMLLDGTNAGAINARKTSCVRGHLLSGSNLRIEPHGARTCKICQRESVKKYQRVKKLKELQC